MLRLLYQNECLKRSEVTPKVVFGFVDICRRIKLMALKAILYTMSLLKEL